MSGRGEGQGGGQGGGAGGWSTRGGIPNSVKTEGMGKGERTVW